MLQQGRVALQGRAEDVRGGHISAVLSFAEPQTVAPILAGAHAVVGYGAQWRILFGGSRADLASAAASIGAQVSGEQTPSLDEILVARAGGKGS